MSNRRVVVCCWQYGHETELLLTLRQEQGLAKKIKKLQAVCPECRNANLGNQPIFIKIGETLFNAPKVYRCDKGHISTIAAFTNARLSIQFGHGEEDFVNVTGALEELPELLDTKDISCHHVIGFHQCCDSQLEAVDDFVLTYPESAGIKTKTRVGDIWDRTGVSPVRSGHYDQDGHYKTTTSERANRERLKRIRERNIPLDRHPGTRIDQPTDTTYDRRSKNDINPERLTGPK